MTIKYAPDFTTVLEISGVAYALLTQDSETLTYARLDLPDDKRVFTHVEFSELLKRLDVRLRPLEMTTGRKAALARTGTRYAHTLPPRARENYCGKRLGQ